MTLTHILARKLAYAGELSESDLQAIERAVEDVRPVSARTVLIGEGDRPEHVHVVLDGFAMRYKILPNGERQVLAWLVPGDFCDLHVAVLAEMDHSVATVTASRVGLISKAQVDQILDTSPPLSRALFWAALVQEAILREWLVSIGRRPSESRMAHFFCELHARLEVVGLAKTGEIELPLTQEELADTLGISAVHTNRVLQSLREQGLITLKGKKLVIRAGRELQELAQFNPNYLHLVRRTKLGTWSQQANDAGFSSGNEADLR